MAGMSLPRRFAGLTRHVGARQFVKFCVVGSINTGADFSAYFAMTRLVPFFRTHYVAAAMLSFCLGVVSSFLLNTFWTFRAGRDGWLERLPKFATVALVALALNALIVAALVESGVHDMLAKVAATGIGIAWNFTAQKKWTFAARRRAE
jgi:putative flippase GtrA